MTAQRLRVWFRKGERVRYISHLDVLRHWERAIRRAKLPLAYSQGFTPHPKITFAAPLPLGFVGEAEIMDVQLDERIDPAEFRDRLARETSADMAVLDVREVPPSAPATQVSVRWADYRVRARGLPLAEAREAVDQFMARNAFEWTDRRGDKTRTIDLRAAVATLHVNASDDEAVEVAMRLACSQELTARPEQVMAAVFPGAAPDIYIRTGLVLNEPSMAREAWRRRGRFL